MNHKIVFLRHVLQLLYDSVILYLVALGCMVLFTDNGLEYTLIFGILGVVSLSYLFRVYAPNYILLSLLHVALAGLFFLLPYGFAAKVFVALECSYLLECSFDYAHRKGELKPLDDAPWPSFLICLILYFVSAQQKLTGLATACYIGAIVMLVLYLVMIYLEGLRDYMRSTRDVSGVPLKKMVGTNTIVFLGIMLCLFVAFFLSYVFDFGFVFRTLGIGLLAIFRVVASAIGMYWSFVAGWFKSGGARPAGMPRMDDVETIGRYHEIGQALEVLLEIVVIAAMIFLVYKLLSRFIKRLLLKRRFSGDIVEAAEVKSPVRQEENKKKLFGRFRLTAEEKARKAYRQRIKRHEYDLRLDGSRSARELSNDLLEQELDDVSELTECYETIRYGDVDVDRELLKKITELSKR